MKRQSDRQPMSLGQAKELVHAKVMEEQKGITTSALAKRYYAAVSDYPALMQIAHVRISLESGRHVAA